jgi:quinohemoprotein ethanol dehydrogenase
MSIQRAIPALASVLALCGCGHQARPTDAARQGAAGVDGALLANEADGSNWASYGRTYSEDHYSPLAEIRADNVGRLGLAWSYDLDTPLRADSQPLEADGVLYITSGLSVVQAIDALSGKRLWRFDPGVAAAAGMKKLLPSWGVRGLALWQGRVYVATQDGRLIALDARSGQQVWGVQTLDESVDRYGEVTITGAPRVFNGKVVIGFAGAERWARGAISCYDAATGHFLWRFYTVPGDPAKGFENDAMRMAAKTWSGEWWKYGPGGTVWNAITYDPEFNRLYLGTGNGGPWNWRVRNPAGGDALFLASVVALNADTGEYVWHYQENPNEAWDFNSTMDMELATLDIGGRQRKVLMHAPKNGFYYVIDRSDGKLISAEKIGDATWAKGIDMATGRPIEVPGSHYEKGAVLIWPGTYGTHNWQPMSYSPKTRLAYIPTIHQADIYSSEGLDPKKWQRTPNSWNTAMSGYATGALKLPVEEFSSTLQAWDPVQQKAAWKVPTPGVVNGGTMATAGGVVFQGHVDGTFNAYDAANGHKLWTFPAGVSVLGAPISYSVGGHQYVTVLSAPPSGSPAATLTMQARYGWQYREHPRRVLTFRLDGNAPLPPSAPPRIARPLFSPDFKVDAALAQRGVTLFTNACMGCHGVAAVAAGGAPDLRESALALDATAFAAVVRGGTLLQKGMPQFADIHDDELDAIRHYVRQQAALVSSDNATGVRGP